MTLERETQHVGKAITSLVPPFFGKPRIAALLAALVRRVQELEDDAWEVLEAFNVNTADAARLAVLGRVVGQPNLGWDLETYRAVVRARIATNRSHGRDGDIANVLRLITQSTAPITLTTLQPATLSVEMGEPVSAEHLLAIVYLLPKARAAGVRLNFVAPTEGAWLFDSSGSALADASTFDSSATPLTGAGTFGTAITL